MRHKCITILFRDCDSTKPEHTLLTIFAQDLYHLIKNTELEIAYDNKKRYYPSFLYKISLLDMHTINVNSETPVFTM